MSQPPITFAERESARFGMRIGRMRIEADVPDAADFQRQMEAFDGDVVIVRLRADKSVFGLMLALKDWLVLHADSLIYYAADAANLNLGSPAPPSSGLLVRRATPADADAMARAAESAFTDYGSHFHANPLFSHQSIGAGYAEWAAGHGVSDANPSWVACTEDGAVVGFLTGTWHTDHAAPEFEVVLNAVHSSQRRRGVYSMLLDAAIRHVTDHRAARLFSSTQLWNVAVQRAWIKAGLSPDSTWHTHHFIAPQWRGQIQEAL